MMVERTHNDVPVRRQLRHLLDKYFNAEDIKTLCFDLFVDFDNLSGENKAAKIRELVLHLEQNGRLPTLINRVQSLRPQVAWDMAYEAEAETAEPPFKGLLSFEETDADLFFGREQLTADLIAHLCEHPFLAVVGASGSGKSSVVKAGVIPVLKGAKQLAEVTKLPEGADRWEVHVITPAERPLKSLAVSLTRDSESVRATTTLISDLLADPHSLDLFVSKRLQRVDKPGLLLVVDQFEELFTGSHNDKKAKQAREAFVANLLTTVAPHTAGPTRLIITLRADFYGRCFEYRDLRQTITQYQVNIGPMNRAELRQAMEMPSQQAGYQWEAGLVAVLLQEVGADGPNEPELGALPLLSHALLETWKRRDGRWLTHDGYQQAGRIGGAIAQTAEMTVASLSTAQQGVARRIFLSLVALGEGVQDSRRHADWSELMVGDEVEVTALLKRLADARLITTDDKEVILAHEALIREWDLLRQWLDEDRETLRLYRQLARDAQLWQTMQRDESALYRGARLAQVEAWRLPPHYQLTANQQVFITASQQRRDAVIVAQEAARQRELVQAQAIAEAERQRAAEAEAKQQAEAKRAEEAEARQQAEQKRTRLARRAAVVVTILLLLALGAAFYGFGQQHIANKQRQRALIQSVAALAAVVDKRENDSEQATLLALEAARMNAQQEAAVAWLIDDSLRTLLSAPVYKTILGGHDWNVRSVAFSPDGQRLASGSEDRTIRLWEVSDPSAPPTILEGHESWVWSVAFSPDGQRLASGSEDRTIRLWEVSDPSAPPTILEGHENIVKSVAFSPDGQRLVSGSDDGSIRLWEVTDPSAPPTILEGHEGRVLSVAFSPDGQQLVSSGEDHAIRLWEVMDPSAPPTLLEGHEGWVRSVAFSPDGQRLASGSFDHTIRLWEVSDPSAPPTILEGHKGWVLSVAFSPDSQRLVSGSDDGTIRLWPMLEALVEIGCQQVGRNLSWQEWQQYLPGERYRQTCPNRPVHPSVPLGERPST